MNDIISLIDSRIEKSLNQDTALKSMPCRVKEIISESKVVVESIENGAKYTVPNYSGSDVHVGENVQVYYKVNLSNTKSYIGASIYKPDGGGSDSLRINTVYLNTDDEAELGNELLEIAEGYFTSNSAQDCFFHMNALVEAIANTVVTFHVLFDGVMQDFISVNTMSQNEIRTIELTVPIESVSGEHTITIEAIGLAEIQRLKAYVWGQDIIETEGTPTYSGNYIYHDNTVDKYIGTILDPCIPPTLGSNDVLILGEESFTESEVVYTKIPDGVEEIK